MFAHVQQKVFGFSFEIVLDKMFKIRCQLICVAAAFCKDLFLLNSHIIFLQSLIFCIEVGRDEGERSFDHDDGLLDFVRVGGPEKMVATYIL